MNKHVKGQKKSLWPTYEFRVSKNLSTHLPVHITKYCWKETK